MVDPLMLRVDHPIRVYRTTFRVLFLTEILRLSNVTTGKIYISKINTLNIRRCRLVPLSETVR